MALEFGILVSATSWTIIHPFWLIGETYFWEPEERILWSLNGFAVHTFPLVFAFFNSVFLNDAIFYMSDIWMLTVAAIIYLSFYFIDYAVKGEFQYPFLNFDDWTDYLYLAVAIGGLYVLHIILSLLIQLLKWRFEWDFNWIPYA